MYPYFVKLKNKFNLTNYSSAEERVIYGDKVITYTKAVTEHSDEIFGVILEEYRKYFGLNLMRITDQVPPHTDSRIQTCINFYIKTENATTRFYETKNENGIKKYQIANQTDGYMFENKNLEEVAHFKANPGDAYVLNVSKIHGVDTSSFLNERIALTLATDMTFVNVCRILAATGNIEINKKAPA
jgi:hypothetical protein